MNFDALKNSSVLLLGKPRAFSLNELTKQLEHHQITLITAVPTQQSTYAVSAAIEGGLLNPLEQDLLEQIYFENTTPIFRVESMEQEIACRLNTATLLMSLKLTKDKERLHGFLTNALISDALFIKLLKLYDFNGEGFFDSDANRDVTAALIERFYDNLEQNHNIQYISMGVVELINKSSNVDLIDALASLSKIDQALHHKGDALMEEVLLALAQHPALATMHQKRFAQSDRKTVGTLLASRKDLSADVEAILLRSRHLEVTTALASNAQLSVAGMEQLLIDHEEEIIRHGAMDDERFAVFVKRDPEAVSTNPTLTRAMFEQLLALNSDTVDLTLAHNSTLPPTVAEQLYARANTEVLQRLACNAAITKDLLREFATHKPLHRYLAQNPALDEPTIYQLYRNANRDVLEALAANEATPLDILYELLLDLHLEPIVRHNSALNTKYQR